MTKQTKTIQEINEKIEDGSVRVVTASEMIEIVDEMGSEKAFHEVDVVTTGTFGAMCSSGIWMNFGHSQPPMKMSRVWLNDVEAYASVAAVDAYLGATQPSETLGIRYGGGHVIEDLLRGKSVHLKAESHGTDCYPRKHLSIDVKLDELNQARMSNPRNCYERYGVAVNTSERALYTYMGKLLPNMENATFSGAGELSPLVNDGYQTIGIGTRIFLGGAQGYVVASGTQHNPGSGYGTLMVQGNLKDMKSDYIKGANLTKYGCTLFVGVGVPIPVLNENIASSTGISDNEIMTSVYDYSIPSRDRPSLSKVSYGDLKSGSIEIRNQEVKVAPLSSFKVSLRIAESLKQMVSNGAFLLTQPVKVIPNDTLFKPMSQRESSGKLETRFEKVPISSNYYVQRVADRCINCGLCTTYCPTGVFVRDADWSILDNPELCVECDQCGDICPHDAILLKKGGET